MTAVSSPSEYVKHSIGSHVEPVVKEQASCVWSGSRRPLLRYVSREVFIRRRETFQMSPRSLPHLTVIDAFISSQSQVVYPGSLSRSRNSNDSRVTYSRSDAVEGTELAQLLPSSFH